MPRTARRSLLPSSACDKPSATLLPKFSSRILGIAGARGAGDVPEPLDGVLTPGDSRGEGWPGEPATGDGGIERVERERGEDT